MKYQNFSVKKYTPSPIAKFRSYWLKKGFELVDITQLCTFRLGNSGVCNDFNEPDENVYHIQVWYRDEQIAVFSGVRANPIDGDKYTIFFSDINLPIDSDFIIFKTVPNHKI